MPGRKRKTFPTQTIINTILSGEIEPSIQALSKVYGCNWVTMKKWVDDHPKIGEALDKAKEELLEKAENVIARAIEDGDVQTAKWILTQLNPKYRDKQDVNVDGQININIIKPKKNGN